MSRSCIKFVYQTTQEHSFKELQFSFPAQHQNLTGGGLAFSKALFLPGGFYASILMLDADTLALTSAETHSASGDVRAGRLLWRGHLGRLLPPSLDCLHWTRHHVVQDHTGHHSLIF